MDNSLFTGKLVRLVAQDPEHSPEIVAKWDRDTEYTRLISGNPVTLSTPKYWRERMEQPRNERFYPFGIQTIADDKLIGFIVLMHVNHFHGDAYVGIGIGEPEYRGKGYGSEAMNLLLQFAFQEMNLHRVSLDAVATNARAVRSYEKCGFVLEGMTRGTDYRDGVRDNLVAMGVLRSEWEKRNAIGS